MLKLVPCALNESVLWRLGVRRLASSPGAVAASADKLDASGSQNTAATKQTQPNVVSTSKSGLVAAAFASLNSPEPPETSKRKPSAKSAKGTKHHQIDHIIATTTDLKTLLSIAENPIISRRHAFKVVSLLSEWASSKKVKLEDFETDVRFLRLCRVLARNQDASAITSLSHPDDLSTVLSVTGDDEAARLVSDLTLPQLIKVMSVLRARNRRSTPLLRTLAHNLTRQDTLNVKQAADLLFSCSQLNFPDPPLLDKVCNDIISSLSSTDRVAGVHSCIVSLGLLRYRHTQCLDALTNWVLSNSKLVRPHDIVITLQTLSSLNYQPSAMQQLKEMAQQLSENELPRGAMWLELCWSLLLLDSASVDKLRELFTHRFIDRLYSTGEIPVSVRRKLKLMHSYVGLAGSPPPPPPLPPHLTDGPAPVYSRDKAAYVQTVIESLRSLVSSNNFVTTNCNSNMGFLYDAEFAVDSKCHPISLEKAATDKTAIRIAVLSLDYHDLTRKTVVPLGINLLYTKLLQLKGYRVLVVPFTELSSRDKPVERVQLLQTRLREAVAGQAQAPA